MFNPITKHIQAVTSTNPALNDCFTSQNKV